MLAGRPPPRAGPRLRELIFADIGKGKACSDLICKLQAASRDGASSEFIAKMNSTSVANAARNVIRKAFSDLKLRGLIDVYKVKNVMVVGGSDGVSVVDYPIFLPHELFGALARLDREKLHRVFGQPQRWQDFWHRTALQDPEPEWFRKHPIYQKLNDGELDVSQVCPIRVFGDETARSRLVRTMHICSELKCSEPTHQAKLPLYVIRDTHCLPGVTEECLQRAVTWSMQQLLNGTYPETDMHGEPWPEGSFRRSLAGQQLDPVNGLVGALTSILADWEWVVKQFRFRHWYNHKLPYCCHLCRKRMSDITVFFQECEERPASEYAESPEALMSPLSALPGFCSSIVFPEPMHCGPLGAMQHAIASTLVTMAFEGLFDGVDISHMTLWQHKMNLRLSWAYDQFKQFCRQNGVRHSVPRFTTNNLRFKTLTATPFIRGSAHNNLCILHWLADCSRLLCTGSTASKLRATMCWSMHMFFAIPRTSKNIDFLSDEEIKQVTLCGEMMLKSYASMRAEMVAAGSPHLFWVTPKFHMVEHCLLLLMLDGRNFCSRWTFSDEKMMSLITSISAIQHSSQTGFCIRRWCVGFLGS